MDAKRVSTLALYRRLLFVAKPFWPHIGGLWLLSLLSAPVALLMPLPLKIVVDNVIGGQPLPSWLAAFAPERLLRSSSGPLAMAVLVLAGVAILSQLQGLGIWVLQTYASEQFLLRFRGQLFAHVQRLSFSYHDRLGSVDSTYRIQYDSQSIATLAVYGITPFVTSGFMLVAMVAVIVRMDWTLAIVAAGVVPPLFLLVRLSRERLLGQWEEIKANESSAMSVIQEVLGALRVVKAFGQEERERKRFVEQSRRSTRGHIKLAWTQGTFDLLVGLTIAAGMGLSLFVGTLHVQSGALSLGGLVVVMAYLMSVLSPVETMTRQVGELQSSVAGAARAFAVFDEQPEVVERAQARRLVRARGAVAYRNVSFAYTESDSVLHDISFEVPPGARVGIAGATGAGKTTLVNLLARFHDPSQGQILLDDVDLRDYRLADLRNQFAIVLQEPVLFSTSLAENIAYARPGASFEQIVAAAKAASAHDFIRALPAGYDTQVGERGVMLSGGERQRISLARAFLKDAPLLILDEPTSSVDVHTEALILQAMNRLMQGRTTFIIAHRLKTLEHCDVGLVLDHGRLVRATREGRVANG